MTLRALSGRQASIFACLADAVVAPAPPLPRVCETDAVPAFDAWVEEAPLLNRLAIGVAIHAIEVGPVLIGLGNRMRRLPESDRARYLRSLERAGPARMRQLTKVVKGMAFLTYYSDAAVMRRIGYDADANVRRGRRLRAAEGRS